MATRSTQLFRRCLHGLALQAGAPPVADHELLQRFTERRDEAAFAALVQRHGPMVLGVCRRLLHDPSAAEDAFQAVFLVLSKRAETLGRESLASWLHGVARRTALKASTRVSRRRKYERGAVPRPAADPLSEVTLREALSIIDEELLRLPEKFRAPIVHCCLEGRTRDEAAHQLGWSLSILKSRLEQARELLRTRLAQGVDALGGVVRGHAFGKRGGGQCPRRSPD